jgi:Fe2+ transport system protein FeoA/GTP-binding protein EngB required for normal cell division
MAHTTTQSDRLDRLAPPETAVVRALHADGPTRRRMLDLGLVPGTLVQAVLRSASGSPTAYAFRGAVVALRDDDAALVEVGPVGSAARDQPARAAAPTSSLMCERTCDGCAAVAAPAPPPDVEDFQQRGEAEPATGREPKDTDERQQLLVALAGNPNTGKSTVFNALTGLRQRTGNWPGKTVQRSTGRFERDGLLIDVVDLPGTYSLVSDSPDEQVARDFLLHGRPDVTVLVIDATALERNLGLFYQLIELQTRVVVCLNLIDEAERAGLRIDAELLATELGVPVVPTAALHGRGLAELVAVVIEVARGQRAPAPVGALLPDPVERAIAELIPTITASAPWIANPRWAALRLLDGDTSVLHRERPPSVAGGDGLWPAVVPTR